MTDSSPDPVDAARWSAPTRRFAGGTLRTLGLLAIFASLFLACGWSVYWYVARHAALQMLERQIEREQQAGRRWACGRMTTGGFPFSIDIDCESPRLEARVDGESVVARATRAAISAPLYTPKLVTIELHGPIAYAVGGDQGQAAWKSMQISLRGLPDRLDRLSVVGDSVQVSPPGGHPEMDIRVGAMQFHWRRTSPAYDAPYNLIVGLGGVQWKTLDEVAGSTDPALVTLISAVSQVDRARTGSLRERAESWRAAGGRLTIGLLSLTKGKSLLQGEGTLGLDQTRRLDGKLDLQLHNAGGAALNAARRAGIIAPGGLLEGLAAALLGRSGDLKFALAFENGQLSIGPLKRLVALPPLY